MIHTLRRSPTRKSYPSSTFNPWRKGGINTISFLHTKSYTALSQFQHHGASNTPSIKAHFETPTNSQSTNLPAISALQKHSFFHRAINKWNALPLTIRNASSVNSFRNQLF
eukprot:GHVN01007591.1.p2 GENE.GHVN01007591.1~~GHVN01007591.1.p2  ORF type:complete len:111 (-),score=12.16 GHVN01007591.1:194-526(-)